MRFTRLRAKVKMNILQLWGLVWSQKEGTEEIAFGFLAFFDLLELWDFHSLVSVWLSNVHFSQEALFLFLPSVLLHHSQSHEKTLFKPACSCYLVLSQMKAHLVFKAVHNRPHYTSFATLKRSCVAFRQWIFYIWDILYILLMFIWDQTCCLHAEFLSLFSSLKMRWLHCCCKTLHFYTIIELHDGLYCRMLQQQRMFMEYSLSLFFITAFAPAMRTFRYITPQMCLTERSIHSC